MSYQTFINEIGKGLRSPVYFFYATDSFLHREAINEIKRLVPEEQRDFNFHLFDISFEDEKQSVEEILNVARTGSFFGGRRFTILTGDLKKIVKKDFEKLNRYILSPSPDSVFILLHHGALKKELKEKLKTLKPVSLDIRESDIQLWVKQKAMMKGVEISDKASEYLIGITGTDLGLLASELEKISLLAEGKIQLEDIADIVAGGRSYGVFELVDALKGGNTEAVFRIYNALKGTAEDFSLIGALNWQYGRIRRHMMDREEDYFSKVFRLLNEADIDIKSSGRTFPMELLLFKLLRLRKGRLPSL